MVVLTGFALIATWPLATLGFTASAFNDTRERVTPESTVTTVESSIPESTPEIVARTPEVTAEGVSAFRSASAFRAAGDLDGVTSTTTDIADGLWTVSSQGEIRHVKAVPGTNKYKIVETFDVPNGEFWWKPAVDNKPQFGDRDPDGIANPITGVRSSPSFKGVQGGGSYDGLAQNETYIYVTAFASTSGGGLGNKGAVVFRFHKANKTWERRTRTQWQNVAWGTKTYKGETITVNMPPQHHVGNGVRLEPTVTTRYGSFNFNSKDNTLSNYYGSISGGGLLSDGTYVFGGSAKVGGGPPFETVTKIYALTPNNEVKYLGFVKFQKRSKQEYGNFVVSENGDLYLGDASLITNFNNPANPGGLWLSVRKISAADLKARINNSPAVFDTNQSNWKTSSGATVNMNSHGTTGVPSASIATDLIMNEQRIHTTNLPNAFAGFDISPAGNLVIATQEREIYNGDDSNPPTYVREYDFDGNIVGEVNEYKTDHSRLDAWIPNFGTDNPFPGGNNVEVTDMSGFLSSPPPMREVTVKKLVTAKSDASDEFTLTLQSDGVNESHVITGAAPQPQMALSKIKVPLNKDISLRETISANQTRYSTSIKCVDEEDGSVVKEVSDGTFASFRLTKKGKAPIVCTVTNKAKFSVILDKQFVDVDGRVVTNGPSFKNVQFRFTRGTCAQAAGAEVLETTSPAGDGSFSVGYYEEGNYCLTEIKTAAGYKISEDSPWDIRLDANHTTNQVKNLGDVKNKAISGTITINKYNAQKTRLLKGSEWRIERWNGRGWGTFIETVVDNSTNGPEPTELRVDSNTKPGVIAIKGLNLGWYRVIEKKAPAGYLLPVNSPGYFELNENSPSHALDVTNEQASGPTIPLTGGWGTVPYLLFGFITLSGAAAVFVTTKQKRI